MLEQGYGKNEVHLLNRVGVPTGTLSREVIILSEIDYNRKEYGCTLTCYSLFVYRGIGWVGGRYGRK